MNYEVLGRRTGLSAGLFGCAIAWSEIGWMIAAIKRYTFAEGLVAFAAIAVIGLLSGGLMMRLLACTQVDDILEMLNTNHALFKRQVMWSGLKYLCLSWIGILVIQVLISFLFGEMTAMLLGGVVALSFLVAFDRIDARNWNALSRM